jgi:type I restriction enzyme S subunit
MKSETKVESEKSKVESVVRLAEVAELNPRISADISPGSLVSFVPMAAVSEESASVISEETRVANTCVKGFTPFKRNDVLVAKITPCFENGKIVIANIEHEFGFGSTEFHVIRPKEGVLDERYLLHCLRQPSVRTQGQRRMTGSAGQRRVPAHFLSTFALPLPPFKAQRRIAEILDRSEALRAKRRAALALLDELTQSIFLDMFGDPVTNPKGWDDSRTLADIASIGSGITKGRRAAEPVRTVPYLAVVNVQDKILDLSIVKTIEATEREIERYRLKKNDLLLTEGGDADKLGRGTLWSDELPECIHQNHIFRVRIESNEVSPLFLNWLVGGPRGKCYFLRQAKQTTGIATINMTQLKSFPMLIPPLKAQLEFANRVSRLEILRSTHLRSVVELDQLFASLQHRAFRGEL